MEGSPGTRALASSVVVGALTGTADTVLTLGRNPDPVLLAYRLGYVLGPLLVALACAMPAGFGAAWVFRRLGGSASRSATVAAGAVASLWAVGVVLDAWASGARGWTLIVLMGVVPLAAAAMARFGEEIACVIGRLSPVRRRRLWTGAAVVLLAGTAAILPASLRTFRGGGGPCPGTVAPVPSGPNILLITVDALRADVAQDMRSYRRLAASGIEYRQHLTQAPWTLPAIASLLTGLPPEEHGAGRTLMSSSLIAKSPVPAALPTLAGVLGAAGYRTHAIVTNPFLTARYGVDQGFCTFENVTMNGEAIRGLAETTPLRLARALVPHILPSDRANVVGERAERWLTSHDGRPFFLWLHFLDPHAPYGDRDGASTSLTLDLMALQADANQHAPFRAVGLLRAGEYRPDTEDRRWIASLYREDVAFADQEIDRLLDVLADRGLMSRTAIVFTADHGEEFWEHGGVEHGRTLYDEVLRVPLVIAAPELEPATRPDLSSVIDVAPTILALARVPAPTWPGLDLVHRHAAADRLLTLGNLLFGEEWSGVRTADLKYMRSEDGEERLFDLQRDPEERINQVAGMPDALDAIRAALPRPGARELRVAHEIVR
jgi:arylsulfatase